MGIFTLVFPGNPARSSWLSELSLPEVMIYSLRVWVGGSFPTYLQTKQTEAFLTPSPSHLPTVPSRPWGARLTYKCSYLIKNDWGSLPL